jgi:hypothetical protein
MNALAKKFQVKPGSTWLLYNAPAGYLSLLEPLPEGAKTIFAIDAAVDGIQLFAKDSAELYASLRLLLGVLQSDTIFWVVYPKKSSGIQSDFDMPRSWDGIKRYKLRPVTSIGVDEIWTAIRLKPDTETKVSEFCNEEVKQNEHAVYIDLENRQINPPPDLKKILESTPRALTFFQSLSFTNKKEYVVWILSAKQEKTRLERLSKITEKLLAGKKNPSEK